MHRYYDYYLHINHVSTKQKMREQKERISRAIKKDNEKYRNMAR